MKVLRVFLESVVQDAIAISLTLFKLMVPIVIGVKVLTELGAIEFLSAALEPVMGWVGLPGSMGVVWATAMLTNLYGGMVTFAALAPAEPVTAAQVTVLTGMMLIAHNLPVELRVAQKAGARLRAMLVLRVGGALLFGVLMDRLYRAAGWLQEPSVLAWRPVPRDDSLVAWAGSELQGLLIIFLVVVALLVLLRVLERIRVIAMINRMLRPLLRVLGIAEQALTITLVGMTLGIAYGGGLLIRESQAGHVSKRDVLFSLSLLGICHSVIEDTLLMVLMGGHLSGILWARLALAVVVVFLMVRIVAHLPDRFVKAYLIREERPRGERVAQAGAEGGAKPAE